MVEDSNGGEGVGRKKKSTQCLAILREIFKNNNNNNNNNTYTLNKLGPNMKI